MPNAPIPPPDSDAGPLRPWWKRWLRRAWSVARIYLLLCLLMMLFERYLVFPATSDGDWNPPGLRFRDVPFNASDGTKLHGWYFEHPSPRAVVLFAHGNGGNLSHRGPLMQMLRDEMEISIFIFDYRGYGKSEGSPDEAGILDDSRAARAWLTEKTGKQPQDIVLMGRSLGGGVAADLAAADGARGLILESTFTSLPDVAAHHYPWLPVRWLMRTRLNSLAKIANYQGPVLQSHGTADRMIPMQFGRDLYQAIPDPGKRFIEFPGLDHNDYDWTAYQGPLKRFFDRLDALESSL